ncbi:hypothetical protein QBC34DRAFT_350397 [Podospora aff. communis PSN243]|uniref:Nephrocystin 3-like N-terminal domain-containing protein n=1 Tax=Podospora aff. communis PSN243 TaxID=3040156 RepID=A0AAV9GNB3_9PEZI|nr:hypothetical protein QBC34DRAFT_350397 [Podospora aff. communis PSN243]
MEPFSASAIATGVITFFDFGSKLVTLYLQVQGSDQARPLVVSVLERELSEVSNNATRARETCASLQARYPQQFESLSQLATECTQVEEELQRLANALTAKSGHGLRTRGAQALASIRSLVKKDEIEGLQGRLRNIRERTTMTVIVCLLKAVYDLQPEFQTISRSLPLATDMARERVAHGLWTSIATASYSLHGRLEESTPDSGEHRHVCDRILASLEFEDIRAREDQIKTPFPETFSWILQRRTRRRASSLGSPSTGFVEWLESRANDTPFWITGKPASGKSTLMKFLSNHREVREHIQAWCGDFQPLLCTVYFWNPGSSAQKSQLGLLRTLLYQLLRQQRELCRNAAPGRYLYFQLAGHDSPEPPDWTIAELQEAITHFMSRAGIDSRLAMFIDGLDEYDGDHNGLISFVKSLHDSHKVKLCVSSRPWVEFRDAFAAYPSLRMEQFTKPDIEKYVRRRIGESPAFRELRALHSGDVDNLESQIIERAEGVFLWVVLVTEQIISTACQNNDLYEIWNIFNSLPPGLEELYDSMLRRLSSAQKEVASKMYQLLFRWNDAFNQRFGILEFRAAINCHDPSNPQPFPAGSDAPKILPVVERRLSGITGGILQVIHLPYKLNPATMSDSDTAWVEFLHRTVRDWLIGIMPTVIEQGPAAYDPALVLASIRVAQRGAHLKSDSYHNNGSDIRPIFEVERLCSDSPETRGKLRTIIDQLLFFPFDWKCAALAEFRDLAAVSDSNLRSLLATKFICPQYLQAKWESASGESLLQIPRHLRFMPLKFWDTTSVGILRIILVSLEAKKYQGTLTDLQAMNMSLKTIELLDSANVVPRRVLRACIKQRKVPMDHVPRSIPTVLCVAVLDGLGGKGWKEIPAQPINSLDDTTWRVGPMPGRPRHAMELQSDRGFGLLT